MAKETVMIALTFAVYLSALLIIGYVAYRRTRNLSDYILGGRRLGYWVTALSAGASDMSGWLLLGLPGYAYASGFEAGWIALGLFVGTYFNWRLVAKRLRIQSEQLGDALTLPDYFEKRFDDHRHILRLLSAFFILLFFLFYTSSGLVAGGKLFNAVFDMPYHWALVLGTSTILIYTFAGGFLAVSWTDFFQGLLMALVLLIVPLMAVLSLGGWHVVSADLYEKNPALLDIWTDNNGVALSWMAIISLLGWGLGYFGQPHILARFKAIKSPSLLDASRRVAMTWVGLSMLGALFVGFTGVTVLDQHGMVLGGADTEKVFIHMVDLMFHPLVAGVCLAAILAAIMSTADSQLLVSASVITDDFYRLIKHNAVTEIQLVWVGRLAVMVIALVAMGLAWNPDSSVLELVAYAWAGFGAAFGPSLLFSLFWSRMTRQAAIAGILSGGLCVVVWKQLHGGWFDLYELVPGFIFSVIVIVVTGMVTSDKIKKGIDRSANKI